MKMVVKSLSWMRNFPFSQRIFLSHFPFISTESIKILLKLISIFSSRWVIQYHVARIKSCQQVLKIEEEFFSCLLKSSRCDILMYDGNFNIMRLYDYLSRDIKFSQLLEHVSSFFHLPTIVDNRSVFPLGPFNNIFTFLIDNDDTGN